MLDNHHRDVVKFHGVWQCDERALRCRNYRWLIVIHPIADVLDAGCRKVLRRVVGLRQSRTEPADRRPTRKVTNDLNGAGNHRALIIDLVDWPLLVGMTHKLPTRIARLLCNPRIVFDNAGIDRYSRADARALDQLEEPPDADPHAVLVPAPIGYIRQQRDACRRGDYLPRHGAGNIPDLQIDNTPNDDAPIVRQLQRRPVHDRRIRGTLARRLRSCGYDGGCHIRASSKGSLSVWRTYPLSFGSATARKLRLKTITRSAP